jgi:glycosyltransferase involved in cell wall biosynthesis
MGAMLDPRFDQRAASAMPAVALASGPARVLRVLSVTTLFPSSAAPRHGIFVETRLRKLREVAAVDVQVIAPVPWFPLDWKSAGRYATYAATPAVEVRDGVTIRHPRFGVIPRVGLSLQPGALARACARATAAIECNGWSCDVIDAHYLYPDAVAAALLARRIGKPFVATARGSDVNVIARMPGPRRRILEALEQAGRVITVSEALKRSLEALGIRGDRIEVLRNGVDTALFAPGGGATLRARLGIGNAPLVLSVGNLVEAKGHDLVLAAVAKLPAAHLAVIGEGPESKRLLGQVEQLGMAQRTHFFGNMAQAELAQFYSAADVLALGSVREGWPNVVLEAMACGAPVVAADVGGVREIVADSVGEVVEMREAGAFAAALERVLGRKLGKESVRAYAQRFSWDPIASRYFELLHEVAHTPAAKRTEAIR